MEVQAPPPAPPCWSSILKQPPQQQPKPAPPSLAGAQNSGVLVGSCTSSKGIAVAVVDANAIIQGGGKLFHTADRFVSVDEVISEIRDPASRHSLNFLPFTVDTLEPNPDSLKKVVNFAKATGDLQTLSDVDLKLIALTYTFEEQIHGTKHLRDTPPPIHSVNVKRLPEKDLPGWGSNVPNLDEWEALEHAEENGSHLNSRILPLKDLTLGENVEAQTSTEDASIGNQEKGDGDFEKPKRYFPKKREVKIDGKKMVVDGIDASQGQLDDDNGDDWAPAVGRSTRRRFLRRKARREMSETSSNLANENVDDGECDDKCPELLVDENYVEQTNAILGDSKSGGEDITAAMNKMKLEENESEDDVTIAEQEVEKTSQTNEDGDTLHMDDISSEQSWGLRSLSESSVACITSDYAMQNVLLQMGLRLLAPGGMQIRELHRWVLKCHACSKVTTEIGRIFCPTCGNGGTLRKVAVTVSDNGIILAARRPRISLRGTKYSLPLPQGGREAIMKNPILREDQLPQKFLYPKTKKKNKQENDFFVPDDIFRHHTKNAPLQPPVRKAVAVFSGKRNPNDNRFAPPKC